MSNAYSRFRTNANVEVEGVFINYGTFRVRVARAGGSNTKYNKLVDQKSRMQRRFGTVNMEQMKIMAVELLIAACIVDWQVKQEGQWVRGIENPDTGEILPFSKENVELVLGQLPELAQALVIEAASIELFLEDEIKEEAGN